MDKFAFIIHPLTVDDFNRKFSWMENIPNSVIKKITRFVPPFKVSKIEGIRSSQGKEIEGFFIACPLSSRQILDLPNDLVLEKIIKAGRTAEKLGAKIVGLGSFTSVVADKGITVDRNLQIPVTTGNTYTVATAIEGTKLAVSRMDLDLNQEVVTVVGASGSIGSAVSRILAEEVNKIQLVARRQQRLKKLKSEIQTENPEVEISWTADVEKAVSNSRVIISASGAVESLINPRSIKTGSVICDVARPRDVAHKVGRERDDVLVIEGGIVDIPGPVNFNFNFGCPPGTAYACMAETMILTLASIFKSYSLGPEMDPEKVREINQLAHEHGFKLAGLRSFGELLTEDKINKIKELSRQKSLTVSG